LIILLTDMAGFFNETYLNSKTLGLDHIVAVCSHNTPFGPYRSARKKIRGRVIWRHWLALKCMIFLVANVWKNLPPQPKCYAISFYF